VLSAFLILLAAVVLSRAIVGPFRGWMYRKIRAEVKGTPLEWCAEMEDKYEPEGRVEWLGALLGGFEVVAYTLAVALVSVQAGGTFFLVWLGIKMATGWQKIAENRYQLRRAAAALILNLVNFLIALLAGVAIAKVESVL
jgi:hypothetical protein